MVVFLVVAAVQNFQNPKQFDTRGGTLSMTNGALLTNIVVRNALLVTHHGSRTLIDSNAVETGSTLFIGADAMTIPVQANNGLNYFDLSEQKFKVSENAGSYVDLVVNTNGFAGFLANDFQFSSSGGVTNIKPFALMTNISSYDSFTVTNSSLPVYHKHQPHGCLGRIP